MSADQDDARPQKRPRTVEETTPSSITATTSLDLENLRHHEEFWFDDGSIILVARQNTGFRVYRALLAAQSTIFADMFASSSPSVEEMIEGCPVIHLSDAPQDVAHFLHVLLPKSQRLLYPRKKTFSIHQISAIIRLAHKYHVQDVLDQAIESLQAHFTTDFKAWKHDNEGIVAFRPQHAIAVVNLARLADRPSLLPTAFYKCALLGGDIVDGYRREDRTVEYLRRKDVKRCINGRNELAEQAITIVSEVFGTTHPCETCVTPVVCRTAMQTMLELVVDEEGASDADVLASWKGRIHEWAEDLGLCDFCEKAAVQRDLEARKRVWEELPDIFDVTVKGWAGGTDEDDGSEAAGGAA